MNKFTFVICGFGLVILLFSFIAFVLHERADYRVYEAGLETRNQLILDLMSQMDEVGTFPDNIDDRRSLEITYITASDDSVALLIVPIGAGKTAITVLTKNEAILVNLSGKSVGESVSWPKDQIVR